MRRYALLAIALSTLCTTARAEEWGCYDPEPGHPTASERKAFVADVAPHALVAERQYGVPAPALVAMAIHESGFGFTRIALNANNLFGFKWASSESAGGRASWELECQPAWDEGKEYIKFTDRGDAVDFVARRLATSKYYRADTEAFRAAVAGGDDRTRAVQAWVDGISDPYNYKPAVYSQAIKRIINDPFAPSDTMSPTDTLYRLVPAAAANGGGAPAANAPASASADDVRALFQQAIDSGGRYMERGCHPVPESDPLFSGVLARYRGLAAKGVAVVDCRYPFAGKTARVLMANVDAAQLARWVVSACDAHHVADSARCLAVTSHSIWCGSNAQFPVSGVVSEPAEICDGPAPGDAVMTFRDGVTVETNGVPYCSRSPLAAAEEEASVTGSVRKSKRVGRVAMVTRDMYHGTVDVKAVMPDASGMIPWLEVVRDGYVESIGRDAYPLLEAWVKANMGGFAKFKTLGLAKFDCRAYFNPK